MQLFGTEVIAFARTGTPEEAAAAWTAVLDGARAPLADPSIGPAADALAAAVFDELYLNTTGENTAFPSDPTVVAAIAADGRAIIVDSEHSHSYATRRLVVDALKQAQNQSAFLALRSARDAIAATLAALDDPERALTQDLLARLDRVLSPYFD